MEKLNKVEKQTIKGEVEIDWDQYTLAPLHIHKSKKTEVSNII